MFFNLITNKKTKYLFIFKIKILSYKNFMKIITIFLFLIDYHQKI